MKINLKNNTLHAYRDSVLAFDPHPHARIRRICAIFTLNRRPSFFRLRKRTSVIRSNKIRTITNRETINYKV